MAVYSKPIRPLCFVKQTLLLLVKNTVICLIIPSERKVGSSKGKACIMQLPLQLIQAINLDSISADGLTSVLNKWRTCMFFCLKRQTTRCCCCKKAVSTIDRKINLGEECRLTSCKHVFEIGFEKLINYRTLCSERFHEIFISWHFLIHTILKLYFTTTCCKFD